MKKTLTGSLMAMTLGLGALGVVALPHAAQAQTNNNPDAYVQAGLGIVSAIDRYEMGAVWDSASAIMKSSVPQDRFVANIAQRRAQLGTIRNREWMSVTKVPIATAEGALPAGQYVSVRFATAGNNGKVMEEVISFRFDDDGQWRLVGYTLN